MKPDTRDDLADAVRRGQQKAEIRSSFGNVVAVGGIALAFLIGGLAGNAGVGFIVAVVGIGFGVWINYR